MTGPETARPRLRRSELTTPASNPKLLALAADVVVIDLEDGVAPSAKDEARRCAIAALRDLAWGPAAPCR